MKFSWMSEHSSEQLLVLQEKERPISLLVSTVTSLVKSSVSQLIPILTRGGLLEDYHGVIKVC